MTLDVNLKQLERKAFRSFFKDGLWDIYLGIMLALMAVVYWAEKIVESELWIVSIPIVVCSVACYGFILGKRHITVPRIGHVKFGPKRKRKMTKATIVFCFSALAGLLLFLLGGVWKKLPDWAGAIHLPAILFSLNCIIVFSLAAYFMDFSRLYGYGILWAVAFPVGVILRRKLQSGYVVPVTFFLGGGIMVCIGIVFLFRFLRMYPLPTEEENTHE